MMVLTDIAFALLELGRVALVCHARGDRTGTVDALAHAVTVARAQEAKLLELRAVASMVKLGLGHRAALATLISSLPEARSGAHVRAAEAMLA